MSKSSVVEPFLVRELGALQFTAKVPMRTFRAALRAVKPHMARDPELPSLARVVLYASHEELLVAASDRYTLGVAVVPVLGLTCPAGDVSPVALTASEVTEMLGLFTPPKDEEGELTIRVTEKAMKVTDTGGMFAGKEGRWPRTLTDDGPDLAGMMARFAHPAPLKDSLHVSVEFLSRFKVLDQVVGPEVHLTGAQGTPAVLVGSGDFFLGMVMPWTTSSDSAQDKWASWHQVFAGIDTSDAPDQDTLIDQALIDLSGGEEA